MFDFKRMICVAAAAAMACSLFGCADNAERGFRGTPSDTEAKIPEIHTLPPATASENPDETFEVSVPDDEGVNQLPDEGGAPETEPFVTEPPEPAAPPTTVSDVFVELATDTKQPHDYQSLDAESHGYGQGVHFDELNRPRGAVEFNNGYSEYNATAINRTEEKVINLTFDQGYENGFTGKILDTLKEKGVKATFFVVGDYAERQPELVRRMIDEGHTVGSHSVNHYSMPELSVEEATEEIMGLHEYMLKNFGIQMNLFRPPKGEYSERSLAITGDLGYKTVLWSFAYADWDTDNQPDPDTALQKLIDRAHPGAIYLLHSVSETNASILGDFIDAMLAEGYSFGCDFS